MAKGRIVVEVEVPDAQFPYYFEVFNGERSDVDSSFEELGYLYHAGKIKNIKLKNVKVSAEGGDE